MRDQIIKDARRVVIKVGSRLVAAKGTGPLEYQWLRHDAEISGATAATWTIASSRTAPGRYSVLIRNRAGTTVSPATTVTLEP